MPWLFGIDIPSLWEPSVRRINLSDIPNGRRLRTFVRVEKMMLPIGYSPLEVMEFADRFVFLRSKYENLPLAVSQNAPNHTTLEQIPAAPAPRDPDLHEGLQDLAYEINEDIREACFAFDDPDLWYPGVDEGIEPVDDDHVRLVIYALNRELKRELRMDPAGNERLPAPELSALPWRIQRALAERRRLRFQQWGIGRKQWEERRWSVWDVPLDPDYVSRREARGLAEANDSIYF